MRALALLFCLAICTAHAQTDKEKKRAELEQTLNAFADRYATQIVAATSAIAAGNPSAEQRRLAHLIKLGAVSAIYDIVTEPDPGSRMLNLVLVVTLQSYLWIDEDRAEQMFGERGEMLRRAIRQLRVDIWSLAGRMAKPEQLQQLDAAILDWRKRNPDLGLVSYTRVGDVSGARGIDALEEIQRSSGLFAEVAEAARVADSARLLAERAFYGMKRMPFLVNWQAEALINEVLAKPEIARMLQSAENATAALEKVPAQIADEREALVGAIEDRNGRIAALLGEVRKTTATADGLAARAITVAEAAERVSINVRETAKAVDAIMGRNAASAGSSVPEKPFEIEPFLRMAAEVNQTVAGLNSALDRLDGMSAKRAWAPAMQDTRSLLAEQIDRLFWRALALIVAFFVLLLAYRWLAPRLDRR